MESTSPGLAKVHSQVTDKSASALERYQRVIVGASSLGFLLRYEFIQLAFGNLPGAIGLRLRQAAYPSLLRRVGPGVVFGQNVTLRHPKKITIGRDVVIDDGCVLDARGDANQGIQIGNEVILARHVVLGCKNGNITLGDNVGLGAYTIIHGYGDNDVSVGNNVVIGAYTYLVGGSNYHFDRTDIPIAQQGINMKGGIRVEDNVWLGARVTILDGVTIGRDAIIGAGAVVTESIPPFAIAVGTPARVVKMRK